MKYIEGDNKSVSSVGIINFIYNEIIVSRALPSSSVDYNGFTGKNLSMESEIYTLGFFL